MDKDCCKDELTIIKIEDDQSKTQVAEVSIAPPSLSIPLYLNYKTKVFSGLEVPYWVLDDPPDQASNQKIFIRIQSFLIWENGNSSWPFNQKAHVQLLRSFLILNQHNPIIQKFHL